jgi:HEAT repeat protein
MSADDYAAVSTERLLEMFAEAAKGTALGRSLLSISNAARFSVPLQAVGKTSERMQSAAVIRAVGAALRAREAISEVRRLFEDDDPDVRMCAASQFRDIEPERASAAISGLYAKLPTREALALRRRARQAPPRRPSLKEMSDDALVARFEDAAARQSASQFLDCLDDPKDMATHNRVVGEVTGILRELKSRGLLGRLLPSLASPDFTVRHRAAQGCLRIAEEKAVAALDSVVASGSFNERLAARDTLEHWRNGKRLVDGL